MSASATENDAVMGIDPGKSGGYCIQFPKSGGPPHLHLDSVTGGPPHSLIAAPLPWVGEDLDCAALAKIIRDCRVGFVVIEKAQAMPRQGVTSMFKYGVGAGKLAGMLEAMGVAYQLVAPQSWKKGVLAGTLKDKDAAISYVRRRHPTVNLTPGKTRKPHDGIADAVCISDWAIVLRHPPA